MWAYKLNTTPEVLSLTVLCTTIIVLFATGFLKRAGEAAFDFACNLLKSIMGKFRGGSVVTNVVKIDDIKPVIVDTANQSPITTSKFQVKLLDINKAYDASPPLQRDQVLNSYLGIYIEWEATYSDAELKDKMVTLMLRDADTSNVGPIRSIWCIVPLDDYKELSILNKGANVRILGEIEKLRLHGAFIKNPKLHFHQ